MLSQIISLKGCTDLQECSRAAFSIAAYTLLLLGYKAVSRTAYSGQEDIQARVAAAWRVVVGRPSSSPPFFLPARSSAFPSRGRMGKSLGSRLLSGGGTSKKARASNCD